MKVVVKIIAAAFVFLLYAGAVHSEQTADFVLVIKSESRLYLIHEGTEFASFKVAFGSNPKGHSNGYEGLSTFAQLFNWTNGCIALNDRDMDVVWQSVNPGTPIEIRP